MEPLSEMALGSDFREVTLHLNINSERSQVEDVPAVYFVEPTEANIAKIAEDLSKNLYESCYAACIKSLEASWVR